MRITPEKVDFYELPQKTIVIVGTNEMGIHGKGFAKYCREHGKLEHRVGFGFSQYCFSIPTKDWFIRTLPLEVISFYISRFIAIAAVDLSTTYWVTKIGCGLAGYTPEQIAPLFRECINLPNVYLPQEFWDILNKEQ